MKSSGSVYANINVLLLSCGEDVVRCFWLKICNRFRLADNFFPINFQFFSKLANRGHCGVNITAQCLHSTPQLQQICSFISGPNNSQLLQPSRPCLFALLLFGRMQFLCCSYKASQERFESACLRTPHANAQYEHPFFLIKNEYQDCY